MNKLATLAGGCFWCTEAVFGRLGGVVKVMPGYSGGTTHNPTYEEVCLGQTGHAEAIQIEYDPTMINYETLLEIFLATHDPTTTNQQGNDIGPQYRSVIFYQDEAQKQAAEEALKKWQEAHPGKEAVTQVVPFKKFYEAEDYHKNYYEHHKDQAYCQVVIEPKLIKLMKEFGERVK